MTTAILITGHMRTFDLCLPTLHWHVFRHFPGAQFFVSTVEDADAHKAKLLHGRYPGRVAIEVLPGQPVLPLPPGLPPEDGFVHGRPFTHEPFFISVPPQAVIRQLWQLREAWRHYLATREIEHDLVIRCRPDLWFHAFALPRLRLRPYEAHTPWWGRFCGVNDRFALLGQEAARHYHTTYSQLTNLIELGAPLHPETLVKAAMEENGCQVNRRLVAEFSKINPDTTIARHYLQETTAADLAQA